MLFSALPKAQGLYDPEREADSCGVAMITDILGRRSHSIVADGLSALEHLEHRGAAGAEPNSGDGAGLLLQLPVELLREVVDFELPPANTHGDNTFATGICFLPQNPSARATARERIESIAAQESLEVLGWRTVPVDPDGAGIGATALGCMPQMAQLFVAAPNLVGGIDLDRCVYPLRKLAEKGDVYFASLSSRTSDYLVNATDIQIKMAQGAKPGEGGQLPGYKVSPDIAKTRHSTPGVGLISPPPHHDIYSIEDLAQLIHDLKNANPQARIHVKLVSSVGVGTVAAGVSKAHADVVLISGYDGGTGAAPLTSLKHAGAPWEIGLADTQQALVLNGLRDRITVQCDGGMRTARDVIVAALLGAEEYGFATAPLVVAGCIMMGVCHLDTCPVGVATQNPELRARFTGKPEFVENFFRFIAEDVRKYLAEIGFRNLDEAVGRADVLDTAPGVAHWKSRGLDLSPIFAVAKDAPGATVTQRRRLRDQDHALEQALDQTIIALAEGSLEDAHPVRLELPVRNVNRTVGTLLGSAVTRRYGAQGLPDDTIHLTLTGSAGQSIGAFLPPGVTLDLVGDANDYVGKGLSGGRVIVRPADDVLFVPEDNVIAGNTLLFGATSGEVFLRGQVGERFCARNSGALAVVEGVGDHACEYMTGGRVVILGKTGRNMAAGMSGGIAYVLGLDPAKVNADMVRLQSPEPEDLSWLHGVVAQHSRHTGSTVAHSLLSDWPRRSVRFTKVMPVDYQRVLEATRMAKAQGRDVDTAIMEASRG